VSPTPALGALLGVLAALGLLLAASRAPVLRRPSLEERVAPYVGSPSRLAAQRTALAERTVTPLPTLERIARPVLARWASRLERVLGGGAAVRRRLEQAGSTSTVQEFRVEQVVWGAGAFAASAVVALILVAGGGRSPVTAVALCVAAALAGVIARDNLLSKQVRDREARMLSEFPTVADLLALSVAAGEGAVGALERVARVSHGELSRELSRALADARTGASLVQALQGIADRTSLGPLARFVDGIAIAVERGTPLADVLRAQAADVREAGKRALMESGGRKEIAMMVPVVFLVMPVTVLFALYPGLLAINLAAP
jgi:tight adherence protein C